MDSLDTDLGAILARYTSSKHRQRLRIAFGTDAEAWLEDLPHLLEHYIDCWRLSHLQADSYDSVNVVLYAESDMYGPVVFKIGPPHKELLHGFKALQRFKPELVCRVYAWAVKDRAMLMERLENETLWGMPNASERWRVGAGFVIHTPCLVTHSDAHGFPRFGEQFADALATVRKFGWAGAGWIQRMNQAEVRWHEFAAQSRPELLLHGDLHHHNILRHGQGWKLIDPHGRLGAAILEAGPFFGNEWDLYRHPDRLDHMERCLAYFAEAMGENSYDLRLALGLHVVLSTCWSLEDHASNEAESEGQAMLEWLHW